MLTILLSCSIVLKSSNRVRRMINSAADFLEVRGVDNIGEITLAYLLFDHVPGEVLRSSGVYPDRQRITVLVRPVQNSHGSVGDVELEVSYGERGLFRPLYRLAQLIWFELFGSKQGSDERPDSVWAEHAWFAKASVALVLIVVVLALLWWKFMLPAPRQEARGPQQVGPPQSKERVEEKGPIASVTPSPRPKPSPILREEKTLVARAGWSKDREAALRAVQVEPTRNATQTVDLSSQKTKVVLSLPVYDNQGRIYFSYRLTLSAAETVLWQQTLRAPKVSLTGYAHLVDLFLFGRRLPNANLYNLQAEGKSAIGWQPLGDVRFNSKQQ